MIILGLTGSIGMGKSTTAGLFKQAGIAVYDADAEVHALYAAWGQAVGPLSGIFPEAIRNNAVQRDVLRQIITENPEQIRQLEAIVHPLVAQTQLEFRSRAAQNGARLAVLDIPLLYETGGEAGCDYVAVISASQALQKQRVLSRPGMNEAAFEQLLKKQMPDADKRARADFIISSQFGLDFTRKHVQAIIELLHGLDDQ